MLNYQTKKIKLKIATLLFVSIIIGCATQEDLRRVSSRQAEIEARTEFENERLEGLARQVEELKDLYAASLADRRAEEGASGSRQETRRLREQVREMEQAFLDLRRRVDRLETGSVPSTSAVPPPLKQREVLGGTTTTTTTTPERLYMEGYRGLVEGNLSGARERFKILVDRYGSYEKAPDAQFWIAESYYREEEFEEAVLEFQKFIDSYPKDGRVPLAHLKQGLSLINIGRREEAKIFLQTLIDRFPNSEEAKVAKDKLNELAQMR